MKTLPCLTLLVSGLLVAVGHAAPEEVPTWTDPKAALAAHPDFSLQGEYRSGEGEDAGGLQIAALGEGLFHVLSYQGGLPGDGWDGSKIETSLLDREELKTLIADLRKVERKSPTLGKAAPEGARIIFAGQKTDEIKGEVEKGLLWAGGSTTQPAKDFHLHVEFRLPYKPDRELSSQDRGNSGLYFFNNYEIQVLDTFGLDFDAENNKVPAKSLNSQWCASFYKFKTPDVPMSFPPLQWQTYDIDFTAPRFENGEKVKNARFTVRHNGVVVHDDVELEKGTGAGGGRPEKEEGLIHFQGHGNPVAFQNIWLVEK